MNTLISNFASGTNNTKKPKTTSNLVKANRTHKEDTFSLSAIIKYIERNIKTDEALNKAIKSKSKEAFLKSPFKHIKSLLKEKEQTKKFFSLYSTICIINRFEKL